MRKHLYFLLFSLAFCAIMGCKDSPPDQDLAKLAERLGHLQCIADKYHPEMKPIFAAAREKGIDQSPEFLKQKEKKYKCLGLLNAEILRLQTEFDKRILEKGGASNAQTAIYYDLLDKASSDSTCSFAKHCRLRFDLISELKD
jgi:hypothetical protein